jgi:Mg2+ and Co2+ transporter CorA
MNSLNEICEEVHKTLEEIISIGYRKIDKKMLEKLGLLREKAIESMALMFYTENVIKYNDTSEL